MRTRKELLQLFPDEIVQLSREEYDYLKNEFTIAPANVCGCNFELVEEWNNNTVTLYVVPIDCPHGVPVVITLFKNNRQVSIKELIEKELIEE